jgi:hypothetical protein
MPALLFLVASLCSSSSQLRLPLSGSNDKDELPRSTATPSFVPSEKMNNKQDDSFHPTSRSSSVVLIENDFWNGWNTAITDFILPIDWNEQAR